MAKAVLSIFFRKSEAELSGGIYRRGAPLSTECRSQYTSLDAEEASSVGMGFVQAVLALLSSHVGRIQYTEQGRLGMVTLYSTSKRPKELYTYEFTWDERDRANPMYGGFEKGQTYQLVLLHLLTSILDAKYQRSPERAEVIERWNALLLYCEQELGRNADIYGWSPEQVRRMCQRGRIRSAIDALCDALWFSMRYQIPSKAEREVYITEGSVLPMGGRRVLEQWLDGDDLLKPPVPQMPRPTSIMFDEVDQSRVSSRSSRGQQVPPPSRPGFLRRQTRREQPLTLDDDVLAQLRGERATRQERLSPEWQFPDSADE